MGRVDGKVAFVSGAASGIGAATARLLAKEGAAVVLGDLNTELAGSVSDEIRQKGGEGRVVKLDVASEQSWVAAMAETKEAYGRLNIAVNGAGVQIPRSNPAETSLSDWRMLMSVNLDGVFPGTKHALASMMASDPVSGSIINISSVMGLVALADIGPYTASKGGVRLYSKSVALSCAERGIDVRVNSVHPGFIRTPLLERTLKQRFADESEGWAVYNALQPLGRLGEPDDIAYGILYLASDEARFMTGSELVIDGGFTAR
jgi:3(or 17)beta-hydroxysteroid dehydrogenase